MFRDVRPSPAHLLSALSAAIVLCLAGCAGDGNWFKPQTPQLRVTAAAGCPASVGQARDVANTPTTGRTLVLEGAPDQALICLYGQDAPSAPVSPGLGKQVRLTAAEASALQKAVSGISLKAPPGGPVGCPAELPGALAILDFHFQNGQDYDLWYKTTGCQTLDNGVRGTTEIANPTFYTGFSPLFWKLIGTH